MQDIAQQLREEADRLTPAFNDDLHTRTMQRVHAARRDRLAATVRAPSAFPLRLLSAAAGAGLAAVVLWIAFPTDATIAQGPEIEPVLATLADAGAPFREAFASRVTGMRENALTLRDDGERLVGFVVDQLTMISKDEAPPPPTPTPAGSNPVPQGPA